MSVFHSNLFRQQALIAGSWRDAADGTTLAVSNPSTGATLGQIPNMGVRKRNRQWMPPRPRCRAGARSPPPSAPRY